MKLPDEVDFLILGGGIAGLSTAYHLGLAGADRVALLERNGALGQEASAQNAAILRSFSEDPEKRAFARASAPFLHDPPEGFGPPFVEKTGVVLLGDEPRARAWRAILETGPDREALHDEGVQELTPYELRRLAPNVRSPHAIALHCPHDGKIAIRRLVDALARNAERHGVELRTGVAARELLVEDGRACGASLADGGTVRARTVVLAAGAWAGRLGRAAGSRVALRPTRRHLAVTTPIALERDRPTVWSESRSFYHRPEAGGALVCLCDGDEVDPDTLEVAEGIEERLLARAREELAGLEAASLARVWCGLRTVSEDGGFRVGADPGIEGLFWVAGLGGHGMTCGIEVGRRAARGCLEGSPSAGVRVRR